jgi:hypothetical protein
MRRDYNEWIFIAFSVFSGIFIILFAIQKKNYYMDALVGLVFSGIYYLIQRKYPLKRGYLLLGFLPVVLNLVGLQFGFFAFSVSGVGYDKMCHFLNSVAVTVLIYHWIDVDRKNIVPKIFIAGLVVMGFGAFNEIVEFVGQRYFHIYGPGMFSQGDLLPPTITNDLVRYDTWWDMIFAAFGTIVGAIVILIKRLWSHSSRS